ncbi:sensor histidine kinase [Paenibacillus senegalensis]|uniref:sensor histidine kinase n=1 Tax=Paenibacillus senegalensis TaxID=1465766 RepID=UPI000289E294|nr:histidine kinase [Paenibacillus senegalensis]
MLLRPWNKFKQISIYLKLVIAFLAVLLPVYILGLIVNHYAENNVKEKIDESMQSRVHFYIRQLDNEFSRIARMQEEFVNDRDVRLLASGGGMYSDFDWRNAVLGLRDSLITVRNSNAYVRKASIYLPLVGRVITSDNAYEPLPDQEYEALKSSSHRLTNPFVYDGERLFLSFPYSNQALINGREPLFLVSAEIAGEEIGEVLDSLMIDGSGGAMLVDRELNWVLQGKQGERLLTAPMLDHLKALREETPTGPAMEERKPDVQFQTIRVEGNSYWVYVEESPDLGYSLLMYMPEAEMLGSLKQYRIWFWALSVSSLLVVVLFSYWIYLQIHQPLRRLIQAFRRMENGMLHEEVSYNRSDEFGYLYRQFNHTAGRIQELVHEVYEQRYRANLAELRQLQSQINPHFLYNNFFILYRMAKNEENDNIARFASYLGSYFQFITRTHKAKIRLEEEVLFARTYIDIQSFQHEGRIEAVCGELPAEYAGLEVPKLILQPIIENAYQHGLRNKISGGRLEVRFEPHQGGLVIIVDDNGEEMPEIAYARLQRRLGAKGWEDAETTGLVNVHRRLYLEYGSEAGVEFLRRPGGGNRIVLSIPAAAAGNKPPELATGGE